MIQIPTKLESIKPLKVYFWGESLWTSYVWSVLRYLCTLHSTWLVNSAAHMWGGHPYDAHVSPAENPLVALVSNSNSAVQTWERLRELKPRSSNL